MKKCVHHTIYKLSLNRKTNQKSISPSQVYSSWKWFANVSGRGLFSPSSWESLNGTWQRLIRTPLTCENVCYDNRCHSLRAERLKTGLCTLKRRVMALDQEGFNVAIFQIHKIHKAVSLTWWLYTTGTCTTLTIFEACCKSCKTSVYLLSVRRVVVFSTLLLVSQI